MTTMIAIDPGAVSGAYAVFWGMELAEVDELRVAGGQLDAAHLARILQGERPDVAVVERVGAMPLQGVASTFKFGVAVGIIWGALAASGIPLHLVTPQVWKRHHGLHGPDKELSRALAARLWPEHDFSLKKHAGRAEAALIGRWYIEREQRQ